MFDQIITKTDRREQKRTKKKQMIVDGTMSAIKNGIRNTVAKILKTKKV